MDMFSGDNLVNLIKTIGYFGILGIVFAESGFLVGFFLPGDSLLFVSGFLASQGILNLYVVMIVIAFGAIAGDSTGYWFGYKVGPKIFKKEDSLLFHKDNLIKAEKFYEAHGSKTIILARFLPFVRTCAPLLAGVGKMKYQKFLFYSIIGALFWSISLTLLGFYLGKVIPDIDKYMVPFILVVMGVSVLSSVSHIFLGKLKKKPVQKTETEVESA